MARRTRREKGKGEEAPSVQEDSAADERVAELEARCEELNANWLRAQADYKNLRRRTAADFDAGVKRQMQPLLDELLLVLDFLDMALVSPVESPDARNLAMGVEMTRSKFVQALEAAEVREIPVDGVFDPNVHEATETRPTEEADPGAILEVVRKGYTWQGLVLRPARVVVATGGDDSGPAPEEPMEEEG